MFSDYNTEELAEQDKNLYTFTNRGLRGLVSRIKFEINTKADKNTLKTVATTGDYNDLTNKPTIPSVSGLATETYVNTKVAGIVNSAPETLDTLQELANALGNDPNFATTVATEIGKKANSADLATVATTGSYNDLTNKPYYLIEYNSTDNTINHTYDEINAAYENGQEPIVKDSVTNDIYTFTKRGQTAGPNMSSNSGFNFIKIQTIYDRYKLSSLQKPYPLYFSYRLLCILEYNGIPMVSDEIPVESSNSFYFEIRGAGHPKGCSLYEADYNTLIKKYEDNKFIYAMADYTIGSAPSQGLVYLKEYNPTTKALVFEGIVEDYIYILTVNSDGTITQDYHSKYLIGATNTTDGTSGLIPTPKAGDQGKFLRGDATWADVTIPTKLSDLTDDVVSGSYLPLTGGTLTGSLTIKNLGNKLIVNTVSLLGKVTHNSPCLQLSTTNDNSAVFISGVKSPLYNTDAANKEYVDTIVSNHTSATIVTWTDDGT